MDTPIYDQLVTDFRHGFRTVPGERDADDRHLQLLLRRAGRVAERKAAENAPTDFSNTAPLPPVAAAPSTGTDRRTDLREARIA